MSRNVKLVEALKIKSSYHCSNGTSKDIKSAYIHLPFCKRRCYYCDFPIQAIGSKNYNNNDTNSIFSDYIKILNQEIELTQKDNYSNSKLKTIFFGGGTPSLIPPFLLEKVLNLLEKKFGIENEAEISMEADPGTFDYNKLNEFKILGINRFSIGIQSFSDVILKQIGRSHELKDIYQAIEDIIRINPKSWSLDLITGLPNTDMELWEETLNKAISIKPNHISIYDLQIEENTPFGKWYKSGISPLPSEDISANMYILSSEKLRCHNYNHYEISNYAMSNHECQHNMTYWNNNEFYGFGLGAASYLNGIRFSRPKKMKAYVNWVLNEDIQIKGKVESMEDKMLDTIMLKLRMKMGIDFEEFENEFGQLNLSKLKNAVFSGQKLNPELIEILDKEKEPISQDGIQGGNERYVKLTDPEGYIKSNTVISNIFTFFI